MHVMKGGSMGWPFTTISMARSPRNKWDSHRTSRRSIYYELEPSAIGEERAMRAAHAKGTNISLIYVSHVKGQAVRVPCRYLAAVTLL